MWIRIWKDKGGAQVRKTGEEESSKVREGKGRRRGVRTGNERGRGQG